MYLSETTRRERGRDRGCDGRVDRRLHTCGIASRRFFCEIDMQLFGRVCFIGIEIE